MTEGTECSHSVTVNNTTLHCQHPNGHTGSHLHMSDNGTYGWGNR